MSTTTIARFGAISGIVYALAFIPAYLLGTPDAPSAGQVGGYFDEAADFLFAHETLMVLVFFAFLWFLSALYGLLRSAEGEGRFFSTAALAGGITFVSVCSVGLAAEALVPAAALRFGEAGLGSELALYSLTLAVSLYHFSAVGTAVMIAATSLLAIRTGVLPSWFGWLGLAAAVVAVLHVVFAAISGIVGLAWVLIASLLMLTGSAGRGAGRRTNG